jgi:hypothetical protein
MIVMTDPMKGKKPYDRTMAQVHYEPGELSDAELTNQLLANYDTYRDMRYDPTIAFARMLVIAPMVMSEWSYEEAIDAPQGSADFIKQQLEPLRMRYVKSAMEGYVDYGWAGFEQVKCLTDGNQIGLSKFKSLLQEYTDILVNPVNGEYIGLRQSRNMARDIDISVWDSILCTFDYEGTYWYGTPLMENARIPYNSSKVVNAAADRYDAKIAGSFWVVHYPVGITPVNGVETDNFLIAKDILAAIESSGKLTVPNHVQKTLQELSETSADGGETSWKIELISDKGQGATTFTDRMKYLDALKVRAFGIPERAVLEGQFGTKAESESQADFAIVIMDMRNQMIVEPINEYAVNQLLILNYGPHSKGKVKVKPTPLADDKKALWKALYMQLLADPSVMITEAQTIDMSAIRERLGLPVFESAPMLPEEQQMLDAQALPVDDMAMPFAGVQQPMFMSDAAKMVREAAADVQEPKTAKQAAAGTYRKGHVTLHGLELTIETAKGQKRKGTDKDGHEWETKMPWHYGYIKKTESEADGDHIDVFIGPNPDSELVFVIDQVTAKGGRFDEHKCMIGFISEKHATDGYLAAYDGNGWRMLGDVTPMTIQQFKKWLDKGDSSKPVAKSNAEAWILSDDDPDGVWRTMNGKRIFIKTDGTIVDDDPRFAGKNIKDIKELVEDDGKSTLHINSFMEKYGFTDYQDSVEGRKWSSPELNATVLFDQGWELIVDGQRYSQGIDENDLRKKIVAWQSAKRQLAARNAPALALSGKDDAEGRWVTLNEGKKVFIKADGTIEDDDPKFNGKNIKDFTSKKKKVHIEGGGAKSKSGKDEDGPSNSPFVLKMRQEYLDKLGEMSDKDLVQELAIQKENAEGKDHDSWGLKAVKGEIDKRNGGEGVSTFIDSKKGPIGGKAKSAKQYAAEAQKLSDDELVAEYSKRGNWKGDANVIGSYAEELEKRGFEFDDDDNVIGKAASKSGKYGITNNMTYDQLLDKHPEDGLTNDIVKDMFDESIAAGNHALANKLKDEWVIDHKHVKSGFDKLATVAGATGGAIASTRGKDYEMPALSEDYVMGVMDEYVEGVDATVNSKPEYESLINEWVGSSDYVQDEEMVPNSDVAREWNAMLNSMPTHEGEVWRGLTLTPEAAEKLANSADIEFKTTQSASLVPSVAQFFANDPYGDGMHDGVVPVIMKVTSKRGVPVGAWSDGPNEEYEVLLRAGKYRIKAAHWEPVVKYDGMQYRLDGGIEQPKLIVELEDMQ